MTALTGFWKVSMSIVNFMRSYSTALQYSYTAVMFVLTRCFCQPSHTNSSTTGCSPSSCSAVGSGVGSETPCS